MLALCTVLSLCACGEEADLNSTDSTAETSADVSEASAESVAEESVAVDGKVEYTVTVKDDIGNTMAGVMVQLCLDSCIPGATDANGVATFRLEAADYKASVMTMPEGYTYETDATEYYFEDGSTSLTIVLTAAR